MALKSKSFGTGSFELKFKTRGTEDKKKVMNQHSQKNTVKTMI